MPPGSSASHWLRHNWPVLKLPLAALCVTIIGIWTAGIYLGYSRGTAEADEILSGNARRAEAAAPSDPRMLYQRARILERRVWPPAYSEGVDSLRRAVLAEPLNSTWWLFLARYLLLGGEPTLALSALQHAESIDPFFPPSQLEAITLWKLLGEEERALELARDFADRNPRDRWKALDQLLRARVDVAQAFNAVSGEGTSSLSLSDLLTRAQPLLTTRDFASIVETLDESNYADAAFRQRLIPVLLKTSLYEPLVRAWSLDAEAVGLGFDDAFGVPLANGDLSKRAFEGTGLLGWQPTASQHGEYGAEWVDGPPPHIVVTYRDSQEHKQSSWLFYNTVLGPGPERIVTIPIRLRPRDRSAVVLRAAVGNQSAHTVIEAATEEWIDVELALPPVESTVPLKLFLQRTRVGLPRRDRVFVDLGAITVREGPRP